MSATLALPQPSMSGGRRRSAVAPRVESGAPVSARPAPSRSHAGLRVTPRGRVAVVVALALLLFAAFSLGRVGAEGTDTAAPETQTVVVAPGQTLWGIARELAPDQDPRPVVDQIRRLNDLRSGQLLVGQQLVLPVRG